MQLIILLIILVAIAYIKPVPANTVIIVDRNSHYLKTKKSGFYFFNPKTDKVTTKISKQQITQYYTNYFETDDGKLIQVSFYATYHADNLEDVLDSLKSARRSIYDIMNSSIYWATNNLTLSDIMLTSSTLLHKEANEKLIAEARTLNITIDTFKITRVTQITNSPTIEPFKPHLNSFSRGPIHYN